MLCDLLGNSPDCLASETQSRRESGEVLRPTAGSKSHNLTPEAKLSSSFDQPAYYVSDHQVGDDSWFRVPTPNNVSSSDASSSVPISSPPSASHDEFCLAWRCAHRHAERAPRVSSLETKLTRSFLPAGGVSDHQIDAICELASYLRFTHQRTGCTSHEERRRTCSV